MTRPELLDELLQATDRMRICQREYFRSRTPQALQDAKKAERQVDKLLRLIKERPCLAWD